MKKYKFRFWIKIESLEANLFKMLTLKTFLRPRENFIGKLALSKYFIYFPGFGNFKVIKFK